jgi:hypothetical protein
MNTIGASFIRTFVVAVVATAAAGSRSPGPVGTGQPTVAATTSVGSEASGQQPRQLFTIGGVRVGLWAPVEAPYNAKMDRNLAADPLWTPG